MNKSYCALLVLMLSFGMAFGMESTSDQPDQPRTNLRNLTLQFLSNTTPAPNNTHNIKRFIYTPTEEDKVILKQSFASAPTEIKSKIYDELYTPTTPRENFLFLTGDPGMGKSTLAKAIGMMLTSKGGTIYIFTPGDILKPNRNTTSDYLTSVLDEITSLPEKVIVIFEELNKLLENHASEHTDTSQTAGTLWTFMDKMMRNPNFFLIATANETKKISPQLQERFLIDFVKICSPQENVRVEQLQYHINRINIPKDKTINNAFINDLAKRTNTFSSRRLGQLCVLAKRCAIGEQIVEHDINFDLIKPTVTKECFEKALQIIEDKLKEHTDFSLPMTDEERRHKETLQQNEEHFEKNYLYTQTGGLFNLGVSGLRYTGYYGKMGAIKTYNIAEGYYKQYTEPEPNTIEDIPKDSKSEISIDMGEPSKKPTPNKVKAIKDKAKSEETAAPKKSGWWPW